MVFSDLDDPVPFSDLVLRNQIMSLSHDPSLAEDCIPTSITGDGRISDSDQRDLVFDDVREQLGVLRLDDVGHRRGIEDHVDLIDSHTTLRSSRGEECWSFSIVEKEMLV